MNKSLLPYSIILDYSTNRNNEIIFVPTLLEG